MQGNQYSGMPEEQKILVRVAAGGCVRTRRDAEDFCRKIEGRGWQKELAPIYRAALALLKDPAAFAGMDEEQFALAKGCLERMRKFYVDGSECKCIKGPTGSVAAPVPDCPVHRGANPYQIMK